MKWMIVVLIAVTALSAQNLPSYPYNYEEMKQEQYTALLKQWRDRESTAMTQEKRNQAEIDSLKKMITTLNTETDDAWGKVYATVSEDGTGDRAEFDTYMNKLTTLRSDVSAFLALSAEEAYKRRAEIDGFQTRLDALKADKKAYVTEAENQIRSIQSMIDQARNKAKLPNSMYQVERGDYLWKIAGKDNVYGDPYAWTRIYNTNKAQIKDPNMIFPDQVFTISRTVEANQYLVNRGDNLFKISQQYGGTFSWMQLFNANKELITDPNMIMPYQVLTVPNR